MASFNDSLAAMDAALINADTFAESLTIILPTVPPTERAVVGIVDREVPMRLRSIPGLQLAKVLVTLRNDAVYGISTAEPNFTGYAVMVAVRQGGTPERLRVAAKDNPVSQDAGQVTLALS